MPRSIKTLRSGISANQNEFKIIAVESKNKNIVLAMVEKNKLGFWKVLYTSPDVKLLNYDGEKEFTKQPLEISWMTPTLKIDGNKASPIMIFNYIYYGRNAIKPIEFDKEQIPENIKVEISQMQNEYIIYIASEETINLDMQDILLRLKCIKE
ncbi:MAG: hypothetical protein N2486_09135 [Caloramator sp.]|nr:hypothetical protein [Caloramator sp.]